MNAIAKEVTDSAVKLVVNFFKKKFHLNGENLRIQKIKENITLHLNEVYIWSKELEFIGLGKTLTTDNTIKLDYFFSYRLSNRKSHDSGLKEQDLISKPGNYFILGDPGSGKSTTIKRIIANYFFTDRFKPFAINFPILLRLRTIESSYDLYTYICKLLGLDYYEKYEIVSQTDQQNVKREIITAEVLNHKMSNLNNQPPFNIVRTIAFIDEKEIDKYIFDFLNSNKIILILDGYDEIDGDLTNVFHSQINSLALKLTNAKILITSRPNYLKAALHNFSTLFINDLESKQIISLSKKWLSDYAAFITELENKSYKELANRPLFLSFLILLYKEGDLGIQKVLPKSSRDVYEQILELLVSKWDKNRNINRVSKYGKYFTGKRKIDFLSHLAFRLTYLTKKKIFTHDDLLQAYLQINELFDLPKEEADLVAEEVENHTGIIVKSYHNHYEFSHLAIQEFLCALNIVRAPIDDNIALYLKEYPEPLALVVCLSTAPESLFYMIVTTARNKIEKQNATKIFKKILSRLITENPSFSVTDKLGISMLLIAEFCDRVDAEFMFLYEQLLKSNPRVLESVKKVLDKFYVYDFTDKVNNAMMYFRNNPSSKEYYPYKVFIPISLAGLIEME